MLGLAPARPNPLVSLRFCVEGVACGGWEPGGGGGPSPLPIGGRRGPQARAVPSMASGPACDVRRCTRLAAALFLLESGLA